MLKNQHKTSPPPPSPFQLLLLTHPLLLLLLLLLLLQFGAFMSSKVPKFGAWEGGENYTVYFDNARKTKNNGQTINPNDPEENQSISPEKGTRTQAHGEPQMNRDVAERARPPPDNAPKAKSEKRGAKEESGPVKNTSRDGSETPHRGGRQTPGMHTPQHPKAGKSQNTEKGTAIPQFGVWNTDPGQAEDFTGTFLRAREDRNAPPGKSTSSSSYQQTHQPKKTSCFPCFG